MNYSSVGQPASFFQRCAVQQTAKQAMYSKMWSSGWRQFCDALMGLTGHHVRTFQPVPVPEWMDKKIIKRYQEGVGGFHKIL